MKWEAVVYGPGVRAAFLLLMMCTVLVLVGAGNVPKEEVDLHLIKAAQSGLLPDVQEAIRNGADPNRLMILEGIGGGGEITPLMATCYSAIPETKVAEFLLKNGAKVNLRNGNGVTALMICSSRGLVDLVKLMLLNGADAMKIDKDGRTAADRAAEMAEFETVRILTEGKPATQQLVNATLIGAAREGSKTRLLQAIKKHANPDAKDFYGDTALIIASRSCFLDNVRELLSAGADANAGNATGETALHAASERGCLGVMRLLLESGAHPNSAEKVSGQTPLMLAAAAGQIDAVKLLITNGADYRLKSNSGSTALDLASEYRREEVVRYLRRLKNDAT